MRVRKNGIAWNAGEGQKHKQGWHMHRQLVLEMKMDTHNSQRCFGAESTTRCMVAEAALAVHTNRTPQEGADLGNVPCRVTTGTVYG